MSKTDFKFKLVGDERLRLTCLRTVSLENFPDFINLATLECLNIYFAYVDYDMEVLKSLSKQLVHLKRLALPTRFIENEILQEQMWDWFPEGHCLEEVALCEWNNNALSTILKAGIAEIAKKSKFFLHFVNKPKILNDLDPENELFAV